MFDGAIVFMIIQVLISVFVFLSLYWLIRSFLAYLRGDRERAKYLRGNLIVFIIAFVLLWPLTGIRLQQRYLEWRYRPQLYEVAAMLGYTDEDLLVEDFVCGDISLIMTVSCSSVLYFTTDTSVTDLEPLFAQFLADRIRVAERHDTVAGAFWYVNFQTPSSIAIAGNQDASQVARERNIHNYEWIFFKVIIIFNLSGCMKRLRLPGLNLTAIGSKRTSSSCV